MSSFRILGLPSGKFEGLFDRSDAELHSIGARRMVVREKPGTPCRVSLVDAEIGETVVLVPFVHHDVASPYRASGPIFVRRAAMQATLPAGEVPRMLRHRLLSLRGYDTNAMMVHADVVNGTELEAAIGRAFHAENVQYLHVHNARPGCFNCRVDRE
jgi:hypothetical protein